MSEMLPAGTPYQLLFLDLDGTIVGDEDYISPRTLLALERASEVGCTPVLCTGRSRYTSKNIIKKIGRGYGIFLNGAIIIKQGEEHPLHRVELPLDIAREAIRIGHEVRISPLCFAVDEDDKWVYTDDILPPPEGYMTRFPERMIVERDLSVSLKKPPVSIETYAPPETTRIMTDRWREAFRDRALIYEWEQGDYGGMGAHIQSIEADKARAAQIVCDLLHISPEQSAAIGDQINDLELLQWAGLSVCMGNGHPELQSCAHYITEPFAQDGAALAIEKYILGNRS